MTVEAAYDERGRRWDLRPVVQLLLSRERDRRPPADRRGWPPLPFADVYGLGRSGDREVLGLLPEPNSAERGEDPSARGRTYAELYHPDHADDRARQAADRQAAYQVAFSDPGPGTCDICKEVRPLVWSWGLCQPCYSASAFDPQYETFDDAQD
ncbi:hypothetical protein [Streptosporangium sp. V21-05]|uniref:hypothetical protein n=1 Tax=Streptosporangium sp. V21-05 TaxID=3446115 RepID=UPI003F52A7A9